MSKPVIKEPLNDDELEQNWEAEGLEVDVDDGDVLSVGSDDEVDEEEEAPNTLKRVREDDNDDDDVETKTKKKHKQAKPSKGLHKMTALEHFKIVNDAYIKHCGGQMTTLELAQGLSENDFVVPTGLGKHTLKSLPLYMHKLLPSWKKEFRDKNKRYDKSPCFLIISSSALRAVQLLPHFTSFHCKVAKLFAKHIKVQEQADLLEKTFFPIAVGTPGRIKKLLEMGALSLEHTRHVLIDMEKDKKEMTVLELKDTVTEMMHILQYYLLPQLKNNKLKLVLY